MLKGRYRAFIDGELVQESENIVTNVGKLLILRHLASIGAGFCESMAIGVGDDVPTDSDQELELEFAREKIQIRSIDFPNREVLMKATFPAGVQVKVREIGIYATIEDVRNKTLFMFDSTETWAGTFTTNLLDNRISDRCIKVEASSGGSTTIEIDTSLDLSDLLLDDVFRLGFITKDDNCEKITITLTDIENNEMSADIIPIAHVNGSAAQYQIEQCLKQEFTNQDKVWSNILKIAITVKAKSGENTEVSLDLLNVIDVNLDTEEMIVSRSLLSSPINKASESSLDIEYRLRLPL